MNELLEIQHDFAEALRYLLSVDSRMAQLSDGADGAYTNLELSRKLLDAVCTRLVDVLDPLEYDIKAAQAEYDLQAAHYE